MKKSNVIDWLVSIAFVVTMLVCMFFSSSAHAENVVQKQGTCFVAKKTTNTNGKATKTQYTYKDTDGKTYVIYVSSRGNYYIIRTSKNGNEYKKYLPEVKKALSK